MGIQQAPQSRIDFKQTLRRGDRGFAASGDDGPGRNDSSLERAPVAHQAVLEQRQIEPGVSAWSALATRSASAWS
jgi:hypothetical protein